MAALFVGECAGESVVAAFGDDAVQLLDGE
jgi:hypothetical protein